MNNILKLTLLAAAALPGTMSAQDVDRTKYPDYSDKVNPDYSLLRPMRKVGAKAAETRPDHYNNADTPYFPPVFNQSGGSCGSASRICYMFSHELNSFRNTDGKDPHNYYPSHFVWLLTNGNSGKDAFVQHVGVPSAATYGGQTYSSLFGYQEETNNDFGWMTGYEKWYEAMFNRMLQPSNFPVSVQSEEGREAVKNWLWNHNGDSDFHSGGIVGIGVASGGNWQPIPSTPTNDELGVTNKYYVKAWGKSVDHALTVVGYDDRIEFDLDGNGVYGEKDKDEVGAWIVVNSWGDGWCNGGFIYCPYANAGPAFAEGATKPTSYWQPEIYRVRKNYVPKRTIKIKMDYSRRSELYLSAGVSSDVNATEPEKSQAFDHFKYAGDGANGDTNPAPEIPMLGRWADGKLHTEPMEFGYDLTDLTDGFDMNKPLKYFFMIDTKSTAIGEGHVYSASIIDYVQDALGIETPFATGTDGVSIQNKGNRTIISVVVQGEGIYSPENVTIADGAIHWTSPVSSANKVTGYKVYQGDNVIATLDASATKYELTSDEAMEYGVTAVYGTKESTKVTVSSPSTAVANQIINLQKSGFSIPDVFGTKYNEATIEYWISPNSLANWNQSAGPGWGQFMFHANADGTFTAGWDTSNRANVSGVLTKGTWTHVAIVVKKNVLTVYKNGARVGGLTSSKYSGVGGFGALTFSNSNGNTSYQDAKYDEVRIWKVARTANDIKNNYKMQFGDAGLPDDLLAYYKGDLVSVGGTAMLRDHTSGQHHATLLDANYSVVASPTQPNLKTPTDLSVSINQPTSAVYAGMPVTLTATASTAAQTLTWKAASAGIDSTNAVSPTFSFPTAGDHKVSVTAKDKDGNAVTSDATITVQEAQAPDASFTFSRPTVPTGERITFLAAHPEIGYSYKWELPGADLTEGTQANVATSYGAKGNYTVRLTVTTPAGKSATTEQTITVTEVAPEADLSVSPTVVVKGETVQLTDKSVYGPTNWQWSLVSAENALVFNDRNPGFAPDKVGVFDVTLHAANGSGQGIKTLERGLIVCNADSKNGLSFSYDAARLSLTKMPLESGLKTFTIDWWMNPNGLASQANSIGDTSESLLMTTNQNGAMSVSVGGKTVNSKNDYLVNGQWHHYAVTMGSGQVRFYRDGVQINSAAIGSSTTVGELKSFVLSSDAAPMSGQIDEFRVWNKCLTATQLKSYCNEPIADIAAAEAAGLQVYYQFNQSSGDVTDATSNANTGTRTGFGPEGDAWALSKGVFSLNFADKASNNNSRLKNNKSSFTHTADLVNTTKETCTAISNWTVENTTVGKQQTGCHVDADRSGYMCFVTTEDGFDDVIKDHKVYQTITVPAGTYAFTANYGTYEGAGKGSYLVVANGTGLPNTADLLTSGAAFTELQDKSSDVTSNTVYFTVKEETTLSLGLLVNMGASSALCFNSFEVTRYTYVEPVIPDGIDEAVTTIENHGSAIYDLSGRRVTNPVKGGVYVIGGKKVIVK